MNNIINILPPVLHDGDMLCNIMWDDLGLYWLVVLHPNTYSSVTRASYDTARQMSQNILIDNQRVECDLPTVAECWAVYDQIRKDCATDHPIMKYVNQVKEIWTKWSIKKYLALTQVREFWTKDPSFSRCRYINNVVDMEYGRVREQDHSNQNGVMLVRRIRLGKPTVTPVVNHDIVPTGVVLNGDPSHYGVANVLLRAYELMGELPAESCKNSVDGKGNPYFPLLKFMVESSKQFSTDVLLHEACKEIMLASQQGNSEMEKHAAIQQILRAIILLSNAVLIKEK